MSHKITFRECGEGPLIVLLHGYGGKGMHWNPLVASLKSNYRVLILNLSHLYLSADRLTFSSQVQGLKEFIESHVGKNSAHWIGMSYGGSIAWGLAATYPELFASLTMINPMMPDPLKHFYRPEFRHYFRLPVPPKVLAFLLTTTFGKKFLAKATEIFHEEKSTEDLELKGRKLLFVAQMICNFSWILRSEDWNYWNSKLFKLDLPTQLIYDAEDPLFSKQSYQKLAQQTKCQSVIELIGTGHLPVLSNPELIAQEIHQFHQNLKIKKAISF